jgi:phage shock protein C
LEKKLYRSRRHRVFLGVCGGLGEFFNIDPVIIRVIAAIITVCTGFFPGLVVYFIIALIVPVDGSTAATPEQSFRENVADIKDASTNLGQGVRLTFENQTPKPTHPITPPQPSHNDPSVTVLIILGTVLIGIGAFFILENFFHWFWRFTFPAMLILAGLIIIVVVLTRRRS